MDGYYWITEWDGTKELVGAKFDHGKVLIKYGDGLKHVVSVAYFRGSLQAVREPRPA